MALVHHVVSHNNFNYIMYKCYQHTVCLYTVCFLFTHLKEVDLVRDFPFVVSDMLSMPGSPFKFCGMYVYICQLSFYEFQG